VAEEFNFEQSVEFLPDNATAVLHGIPALPGVFALRGASVEGQAEAQPYLTRAADLRRRITRLLAPPEFVAKAKAQGQPTSDGGLVLSKRLNLRGRVARIEYTMTGSEFESVVTLYRAAAAIFGLAEARRRLRLHTPFFLRFTAENSFPRVYSTNRLSRRSLANYFGPFPSRAAADRYCDAVLDLFKLRRCSEELAPYPEHPGCVYQEMKKCLAPCNQAYTAAGAAAYAAEAAAVEAFFNTRGESLLGELTAQREQASTEMEFERAAEIHAQAMRVKAAAALADPLVQPIPNLRAVIVQKSVQPTSLVLSRSVAEGSVCPATLTESEPSAALFLIEAGWLVGPARLSTLGVRAVKEQTSVGSSLFAQPLILQPVPLAEDAGNSTQPETVAAPHIDSPTYSPEERATEALNELAGRVGRQPKSAEDLARLSDHLSLLRRWYYRPEKQRTGEVFLPREDGERSKADGSWPIRRILRGTARISQGDPRLIPETQSEPTARNPEA
jgi:hypothetical protein